MSDKHAKSLLIQHHKDSNDRNGNHRRVYVIYSMDTGRVVAAFEEGYSGIGAVPMDIRHKAIDLGSVEITPREYRRLRKLSDHYLHYYTEPNPAP